MLRKPACRVVPLYTDHLYVGGVVLRFPQVENRVVENKFSCCQRKKAAFCRL